MGFGERRRAGTTGVDPVTGLFIYDEATDGTQSAHAGGVLVVGVDQHLAVSQVQGFDAGDVLLAQASERIATLAGELRLLVRRLPGPHFLILVPGVDETVVAEFADRVAFASDRLGGGLSVGMSLAPHDGVTVQALVRAATVALAYAKRAKPGTAAAYSSMMTDDARDRLAVGRALRVAIGRREIALAYQPQLHLVDGSIVGVEVLARWFETSRGPIAPDRFVAIAEELGLVRNLDLLVLDQACEQLRAWDIAGLVVPRISVNFSPETLRRGQLAGPVAEILARHGIAPQRLAVELVHNQVLDSPVGRTALAQLRDIGVRVCLDDFGTGYASFDKIAHLPIEEIKIDRSFFAANGGTGPNPAVLTAIMQVGNALDLQVVVVGIETAEHESIARSCGCLVGQGYRYARPVPAEELASWLEGRRTATLTRPRHSSETPTTVPLG